ncbi:MAG: hypothetical protein HQK51_00740 [Oligoflexia bacterium]|nr:hypothetical protein [Oligoflexia bacterium]
MPLTQKINFDALTTNISIDLTFKIIIALIVVFVVSKYTYDILKILLYRYFIKPRDRDRDSDSDSDGDSEEDIDKKMDRMIGRMKNNLINEREKEKEKEKEKDIENDKK